jgi:hypothetical protein
MDHVMGRHWGEALHWLPWQSQGLSLSPMIFEIACLPLLSQCVGRQASLVRSGPALRLAMTKGWAGGLLIIFMYATGI